MRTIWCATAASVCLGCMAAQAAPPTVMPLGDSITYGRGNAVDIPGGYRSPLSTGVFATGDYVDLIGSATGNPTAALTSAGETQHNGYRSATLAELDGNLAGSVPIAGGVTNNEGGYWITGTGAARAPVFPTAVLLLGGINDVAGTSNVSVATALARLDAIIGEIFTLRPDTSVFVSNLTPITGTPQATYGTKVTDYNAGVPAIVSSYATAGRKAYFVDMHAALNNPAADISGDGIHPTQAGYDKMAVTWQGALTTQSVVVANARPTFTGTSNALWSGTGNWSGGAVPAAAADVRFDQARNTNLNVSGTVSSLNFSAVATVAGSAAATNSTATLTVMNGLTHTANSASSYMRIANITLGADQDWTLNGAIGTSSASGVGFTLSAPNGTVNTLNLNGKTLTKRGSGQLSIGATTVSAGNMVVEEGSVRLSVGTSSNLTVGGTGAISVRPNAALILGANSSTNNTLDVTKTIRMEGGDATSPAIVQTMGTQAFAQTIKAPIEWSGVSTYGHIVTSNTGGNTWTFSGNWSGAGTINLTTINSGSIRTTTLTGTNSGLTGLVDNHQAAANSLIVFGGSSAGSANAEWRLSHSNAVYRLNGNSIALGALSGTAGTLANGGTTSVVATIGGKGIDTSFAGLITNGSTGALAVTKTGIARLTLSGTHDYSGVTTVSQGSLAVNGSIVASSGITVTSGATLGGSGIVPTVGGGGLVSPGSSPGILTAPTVDVGEGLDFAFEMTGAGSPAYGLPAASINDVLRLTTGLSGSMTAANVVSIYFTSLSTGDMVRGGMYLDTVTTPVGRTVAEDLLANATWAYYVSGDGNGTHVYGGSNYYTLAEYAPTLSMTRAVVADTANFGSGNVFGAVTQFTAVPEPGACVLAGAGLGLMLARRSIRRMS